MTCKDCFYCACCDKHYPHRNYEQTANACITYKDKSKIIEHKYTEGDTVYFVGYDVNAREEKIFKGEVGDMTYRNYEFSYIVDVGNDSCWVTEKDLYVTKADAENELKGGKI